MDTEEKLKKLQEMFSCHDSADRQMLREFTDKVMAEYEEAKRDHIEQEIYEDRKAKCGEFESECGEFESEFYDNMMMEGEDEYPEP